MRRLLLPVMLSILCFAPMAYAEEAPKPDDHVVLDLAAEDWVATKTARVTVNVEAAVSGGNASSMRADMVKAVEGLAPGDWRLVSFNRTQDSTGLERWSASFESRLPETALGGLSDNAKKLSKAGMQLALADIDFSPTLDEVEAVRSSLRTQLYKKAADQLTALNGALPGRNYRIAAIDFNDQDNMPPIMRPMRMANGAMASMAVAAPSSIASSDSGDMQRSEKIKIVARIDLAALPATSAAPH